jgi:hypothetical protein
MPALALTRPNDSRSLLAECVVSKRKLERGAMHASLLMTARSRVFLPALELGRMVIAPQGCGTGIGIQRELPPHALQAFPSILLMCLTGNLDVRGHVVQRGVTRHICLRLCRDVNILHRNDCSRRAALGLRLIIRRSLAKLAALALRYQCGPVIMCGCVAYLVEPSSTAMESLDGVGECG